MADTELLTLPEAARLARSAQYLRSVSRTCKKFCANGFERNLGAAMVAHRSAGVAKSQSGNMGATRRLFAELTGYIFLES